MMKYVFCGLILAAFIFGIATGDVAAVSNAALRECAGAVTLAISLAGIICMWSGIMRVAQTSGLTELLAKAFTPLLKRLFKGIDAKSKALQYIVLNLVANLLGLGNASTPFGIAAMKELEKESGCGERASDNMVLFVVMNTASLQIIPATVAALRLKNGSAAPMEILPAVWIVSAVTLIVTIIVTKTLSGIQK